MTKEELEKENKDLRKALKFYADGNHFMYCNNKSDYRYGLDWVIDYGRVAFKTLAMLDHKPYRIDESET
jgi:hypothetical protein